MTSTEKLTVMGSTHNGSLTDSFTNSDAIVFLRNKQGIPRRRRKSGRMRMTIGKQEVLVTGLPSYFTRILGPFGIVSIKVSKERLSIVTFQQRSLVGKL